MQFNYSDGAWLRHWQRLSLGELAAVSGLTAVELHELVDYGVLTPANPQEPQWAFSTDCVLTMRRARRLRDDLGLDTHALALAFMLLDRIEALEARIRELSTRLPDRQL